MFLSYFHLFIHGSTSNVIQVTDEMQQRLIQTEAYYTLLCKDFRWNISCCSLILFLFLLPALIFFVILDPSSASSNGRERWKSGNWYWSRYNSFLCCGSQTRPGWSHTKWSRKLCNTVMSCLHEHKRFIGDAAKNQIDCNPTNTVFGKFHHLGLYVLYGSL